MALKKPNNEQESQTDWEKVKRQEAGLEPIDFSDSPERDSEWFARAQISYPGWLVFKANIDRDVWEFIEKRFPDHVVNMVNQVLLAYMNKKFKVVIPVKEYSSDRVKVVGKYDPELVAWIKGMPNQDGFISLMLRDFMQNVKETDASGKI
jgi:hypothetical protein